MQMISLERVDKYALRHTTEQLTCIAAIVLNDILLLISLI